MKNSHSAQFAGRPYRLKIGLHEEVIGQVSLPKTQKDKTCIRLEKAVTRDREVKSTL